MEYNVQLVYWCFLCLVTLRHTYGAFYTNLWAVHIKGGERKARSIADLNGFTFLNTIMEDHYHFYHRQVQKRSTEFSQHHHNILSLHTEVLWFAQQEIKKRVKRDYKSFNDISYSQQWYLQETRSWGKRSSPLSMNVPAAWRRGYSGKGVVVTVLDDGIERMHPDLIENYDPRASYDINGQDTDPTPKYDFTNENRHGTRCAGEVAASANNSVCGVGVAYEAHIGGIRMLDGEVTDSVEAMSLSLNHHHIDIYSASWGPDDDGKTVDGPATLTRKAFRDGVSRGRRGKGSIFVWASGNGGSYYDNCNCDGYTNSIYTLSVSSATEKGNVPWYSEACSSTLVTTFSSGDSEERQITTTDLRKQCTHLHTGTSASAPLAAGIVALVLQANPTLTWRDVQYISVLSASAQSLNADDWIINGAGHKVSHHFGFGMMDAGRMVDLAANWTNLPEQHICEVSSPHKNRYISPKETVVLKLSTLGCQGTDKEVNYLEHVQAKITLSSSWRGDIQMWLTSPSGTKSSLLTARVHDDSDMGFNEWAFLTTHNWGESTHGEWTLTISNGYRAGKAATLKSWSLVLHGTSTDPLKSAAPTTTPTTTPLPPTEKTIKDTYAENGIILPDDPTFHEPIVPPTAEKVTPLEEIEEEILNHIPTILSSGEQTDTDLLDPTSQPSNDINNNIDSAGIKCGRDMFYLRDQCVEQCPDGYFGQRQSNLYFACKACHYTCAACTGAYNSSCTECYVGSQLYNGQCVKAGSVGSLGIYTGASKTQGLSANGLKSVVYAATSTLAVLLVVLASLVVYYIYHQHKTRQRKTVTVSAKTVYSAVNQTDPALNGSQTSSQRELLESSEEENQSKISTTSLEYRYEDKYGQPV